jgi:hypothetical protein
VGGSAAALQRGQHRGVVVLLVARAVDDRHGAPASALAQLADPVAMVAQFGAIALAELPEPLISGIIWVMIR